MIKVICGTPQEQCTGSNFGTSAFLGGKRMVKMHPTHQAAFRCHARYLVNHEGYEQIGGREFRKDGQPVLVLTKQSRFGAELRRGKEGTRAMPRNHRPSVIT